jgi:5-methylthioribose kinase
MSGGVSCDVWRIDTNGRAFCVKRALPRLRVDSIWEAPVSRNATEWAWIEFASNHFPKAVPKLLALDAERGMFAMEFLDPARFPVWKQLLLDGVIDCDVSAAVANILAHLHQVSAGNEAGAKNFDTGRAFLALRIDPYILEAARRNPDVSSALNKLAEQTLARKIALVHGDVSPKNILIGPDGPVFLDAETAWYGDPAFDLAFCLNHLLLKCLARPHFATAYLDCFAAFRTVYLNSVAWERPADLEQRAARLLPALLLARVDGKSPVEYLRELDRCFVRKTACPLILGSPHRLDEISEVWRAAIRRHVAQ